MLFHGMPPLSRRLLKDRLDRLANSFDLSHLSPDPLEVVRRFDDPLDQEVVGVIAAAFAYGRADTVVAHVGWVTDRMIPSPSRYLREEFGASEARKRFAGFTHRFHKTEDLVRLLGCLAAALRRHGTLGDLFREGYRPEEADIGPALERFVERLLRLGRVSSLASMRYLLTSPADGSACKRMNLYLRWMIRRTEPDLGLWRFADPAKLVMPLDTHVNRITRFLGLVERKSADWKTARELTDRLQRLDPLDPVRYDFAICRLGILALCSRTPRRELCDACQLNDVCRLRVR